MKFFIWTEDKIISVSEMVASCTPSVKIAQIMSNRHNHTVTKNAIIGICHREGIKWPGGRKKPVKKHRVPVSRIWKSDPIPTDPDVLAPFNEYHGYEKKLMDLTAQDCRFPLECGDGHVFCGKLISREKYCDHHYKICYIKEEGQSAP